MSLLPYLLFSTLLLAISITGIIINRKNLIMILLCLELLLLAVSTQWLAFAAYHQDITGQLFVLFILTVAAAETAIGLSLLIVLFREKKRIHIDTLNQLKG